VSDRLHVGFASSNIKGGVSTPLGYRTLVVGPNGSGKSAIQNTVELVLTGRVSDVAGRSDVGDAGLIGLLAPEDGDLTARVELSDERILTFDAARKAGGGWSRPVTHSENLTISFPVQSVRENLTGSPDRARKFLLSHSGATLTRDDVLRLLPEELHTDYATMANGRLGTEIDRLLLVLDAAKTAARTHKQEAEAAEATKARMSAGLMPKPTDAELKAAYDEVDRLAALPTASAAPTRAEMQSRHASLAAEVEGLAEALMAARAVVEARKGRLAKMDRPPEVSALLHHVHAVATAAADYEVCIVCGTAWNDDMRAEASDVAASIEGLADLKQTYAAAERSLADAENDAALALMRANATLDMIEEIEGRLATIDDAPATAVRDEAALAAARDRADMLRRTTSAWLSVDGLRETVWNAQKAAVRAKEIHEACTAAVKDLLDLAIGAFTAKVQAFMPAGDTFFLRLRDGDRDVCQYGLLRDGKHHGALSGAEWARVTLALGCAVAGDADLTVFTPEERAFDPNTLRNVMVALSAAPGQVILTSPIKPSGRTPAGWTIVDRSNP